MSVAAYIFWFISKRSANLSFQKVILFCFSILHGAPLRPVLVHW